MYKVCNKCKENKPFCEFNKNRSRKDGYSYQCKICDKAYYLANKDKILANNSANYALNKEQIIEKVKNYRQSNKDKIAKAKIKYRENNKEEIAEKQAKYRADNKEQLALYYKDYRKANKGKMNANNAKRHASKLQAIPLWLTPAELEQIQEFYICAQMFKLYTGKEYHVDHIVPLRGKNVCGLHVPWNLQVIPAKENLSKSNKLVE
jgi:hypothetical protein